MPYQRKPSKTFCENRGSLPGDPAGADLGELAFQTNMERRNWCIEKGHYTDDDLQYGGGKKSRKSKKVKKSRRKSKKQKKSRKSRK